MSHPSLTWYHTLINPPSPNTHHPYQPLPLCRRAAVCRYESYAKPLANGPGSHPAPAQFAACGRAYELVYNDFGIIFICNGFKAFILILKGPYFPQLWPTLAARLHFVSGMVYMPPRAHYLQPSQRSPHTTQHYHYHHHYHPPSPIMYTSPITSLHRSLTTDPLIPPPPPPVARLPPWPLLGVDWCLRSVAVTNFTRSGTMTSTSFWDHFKRGSPALCRPTCTLDDTLSFLVGC